MFQKLKEKMKKENSKKGKVKTQFILAVILILTSIIAGIVAILNTHNEANRIKVDDPELARAMTYEQVQTGDAATNSEYVNFDAFFLRDLDADGNAEGIRGTCKEIGETDILYMELSVSTNGRLENGVITVNNKNFYLETNLPKDHILKENAIGLNIKELRFNTLEAGEQGFINGIIKSGDYTYNSQKADAIDNDVDNYSQINSITLTGTHISTDGVETPINKTVNFNVDWYGTVEAEISNTNQKKDIDNIIDENNQEITLEFEVAIKETKNQLNLKKSVVEGEIPELNGFKPLEVDVKGENITTTYDEETRKFRIEKKEKNSKTKSWFVEKINKMNFS